MKKIISIVLAAVLLLCISPFAFAATFDYKTILAGRSGYEYSTRNQQWSYYGGYMNTYSDAFAVIGMEVWGEAGGSNPDFAELYAKILTRGGDIREPVDWIEIELGGTTYSYDKMFQQDTSSVVILGEKGQKLIKAIANCDANTVTVKLGAGDGYYTIKIDKDKFRTTLKEFCRVYTKYNLWSYTEKEDFFDTFEEMYPLKINGRLA